MFLAPKNEIRVALALALALAVTAVVAAQDLPVLYGKACYYADRFQGRKMSNGRRYHRDSMTCACLKYPLGTWVEVYAPQKDRRVLLEVTDRGPYSRKFIIDLSRAAAEELGFVRAGFTEVVVTPCTFFRFPYRYHEAQRERTYDFWVFGDSTQLFFPPDTLLSPFVISRYGDDNVEAVE